MRFYYPNPENISHMQELNPHSKIVFLMEKESSNLTTCATETSASIYEIISCEFVQDRQLNKTAIAVLKPNEKIQSS